MDTQGNVCIDNDQTDEPEVTSGCCGLDKENIAKNALFAMSVNSSIIDKTRQLQRVSTDWSEITVGWRNVAATPSIYLEPQTAVKKVRKVQKVPRAGVRGVMSDPGHTHPPSFTSSNNCLRNTGLSDKHLKGWESVDKFSLWNGILDQESHAYVERNGVYANLKMCRRSAELGKLLLRKRFKERGALSPQQKSLQREIQRDLKKEFDSGKTSTDGAGNNTQKNADNCPEDGQLLVDCLTVTAEAPSIQSCMQPVKTWYVNTSVSPVEMIRSQSQVMDARCDVNMPTTPQSLPAVFPVRAVPSVDDLRLGSHLQMSVLDSKSDASAAKRDERKNTRLNNYTSTALGEATFSIRPIHSLVKSKSPPVVKDASIAYICPSNRTQHRTNLPVESLTIHAKRYRAALRPTRFQVISPICKSDQPAKTGVENTPIGAVARANRVEVAMQNRGGNESFGHYTFLPTISGKGLNVPTMHVT